MAKTPGAELTGERAPTPERFAGEGWPQPS